MKTFLFVLFIMNLFLRFNCTAAMFNDRVRVWDRIPQYFVDTRVSNFLNQNRITNCFEFLETETNLLLKCWRDNQLTDVDIRISPGKRSQRNYMVSMSI